MEESRTQRLHELLRRLGKALHATVVSSEEVRECLEELHEDGWQAVMMLEASLVCGEDGRWQDLLYLRDRTVPLPPEPFRFLLFHGSVLGMRFLDGVDRRR